MKVCVCVSIDLSGGYVTSLTAVHGEEGPLVMPLRAQH